MEERKDVFEKVPEFLTAFENVSKNGFFEELNFNTRCADNGNISFCSMKFTGYVPSDDEYKAPGIGVIINPETVIKSCRALAESGAINYISVEIKNENWDLWNKEGEKIIGSKGRKITALLTITFKI